MEKTDIYAIPLPVDNFWGQNKNENLRFQVIFIINPYYIKHALITLFTFE